MIDESVMDKIIPIPEEEKEILKIQKELVEKGFIINNFIKVAVFLSFDPYQCTVGIGDKTACKKYIKLMFY